MGGRTTVSCIWDDAKRVRAHAALWNADKEGLRGPGDSEIREERPLPLSRPRRASASGVLAKVEDQRGVRRQEDQRPHGGGPLACYDRDPRHAPSTLGQESFLGTEGRIYWVISLGVVSTEVHTDFKWLVVRGNGPKMLEGRFDFFISERHVETPSRMIAHLNVKLQKHRPIRALKDAEVYQGRNVSGS